MKISYRVTSILVLATLVLALASPLITTSEKPAQPLTDGWDPCMLWTQQPVMQRIAFLSGFLVFLLFTAQGLRNRTAPRWLTLVGLLTLVIGVEYEWWRINAGCYAPAGLTFTFIWCGSVAAMYLHHGLQPRRELHPRPAMGRFAALTCRTVAAAFVSAFALWFVLFQFNLPLWTTTKEPPSWWIRSVGGHLEWAVTWLFPFTLAATVYRLASRSKEAK